MLCQDISPTGPSGVPAGNPYSGSMVNTPAVLNGVAALILLLPMSPSHMSIQIAVNGLVAFTWTTVLALALRRSA
jgi:hypothetical protein